MHTDMHTYIHTYIHTCTHTYMHTYMPCVLSRSKTMPLGAMGSALGQGALGQGLTASGGTGSAGTTPLSALSTSSRRWGHVQKVTLKQQPVSIFSVEALMSWRAIAMLIYRALQAVYLFRRMHT